jgi:hypothetical protein
MKPSSRSPSTRSPSSRSPSSRSPRTRSPSSRSPSSRSPSKSCKQLGDCPNEDDIYFCINEKCKKQVNESEEIEEGRFKKVYKPTNSDYIFVSQNGPIKTILNEACVKTYISFIFDYIIKNIDIEKRMLIPFIPRPDKIWVSDKREREIDGFDTILIEYNVKYKEINLVKNGYNELYDEAYIQNKNIVNNTILCLKIFNIICNICGIKHYDLHEKNIFIKNGQIAIIDWGVVGYKYPTSKIYKEELIFSNAESVKLQNAYQKYKDNDTKLLAEYTLEIKDLLKDIIPLGNKNNRDYILSVGYYLLESNGIINKTPDLQLKTQRTINDCVCMNECKYTTWKDMGTSVFTKSKKCKVNNQFCKDKKTKNNLSEDYCK